MPQSDWQWFLSLFAVTIFKLILIVGAASALVAVLVSLLTR